MNTESNDSIFANPPHLLPDPMEALVGRINADKSCDKVNLGIGAYRTDERSPYILPAIAEAERRVVDLQLNKEYLPFHGHAEFARESIKFCLGDDSIPIAEQRVCSFQTISGTGAIRIGAEFLRDFFPLADWYIPDPSWVNHPFMLRRVGVKVKQYRYLNRASMSIDFDGMLHDLESASEGSIVILHLCAHNPTGVDLSANQWDQLSSLFKRKRLFAFFDSAYQGFASGDPSEDAYGARVFANNGLEMAVAQSYSKIAGLYGERVGCLSIVCKSKADSDVVYNHIKSAVRLMYLSPPAHGARIMHTVFTDTQLKSQWLSELRCMVQRMKGLRSALVAELILAGVSGDWHHIERQVGMFAYSGLSTDQVRELQTKHHIYMADDGRISIAGLCSQDIPKIASAMHDVLKHSNLSDSQY
eukprot:TRINITY_DN3601_c0_g1_i2.p1 TRINITY_DN3601_c0_g1~~TRINITY_DN3601_c0_g1_i2.p1  ORF type:complete len:416 (-),score=95.90 TRINITY_DN3601_c0_g1_i2:143-1390(-)